MKEKKERMYLHEIADALNVRSSFSIIDFVSIIQGRYSNTITPILGLTTLIWDSIEDSLLTKDLHIIYRFNATHVYKLV